ncbi:MAG TPA: choice-of-anchor Q domain-containing protein, partial [Spirochaetota bacterium]|nr:choice-of-anchor Q domain-containing protein [Spirochaetota bacterium]
PIENLQFEDPLFVYPSTDYAVADFSLQSGSPAIDSGNGLIQVADDLEGNTRPQGVTFDLGAYEY